MGLALNPDFMTEFLNHYKPSTKEMLCLVQVWVLAIVKKLLEETDGEIVFESTKGIGTTVTVLLPN